MSNQAVPETLANRVFILLVNMAIFYVAFRAASGLWLPTGGLESVWLLSALALWFLSVLSAPWFVPPRDALANGIGAMCILVTAETGAIPKFQSELEAIRWIAVAYCFCVAVLSVASLFLYDRNKQSPLGRLLFRLTAVLGRSELLYTPGALLSILGAYQASFPTIAWLIILWASIIFARVPDLVFSAYRLLTPDGINARKHLSVGAIDRVDDPNIVRARLNATGSWTIGHLHVAAMSNGEQHFVLALFSQAQGTDVIGTGLCVAKVAQEEKLDAPSGHIYLAHDQDRCEQFLENLSGVKGGRLVGFTVEGSTIGTLIFEIAATSELQEGDVVFTKIGGHDIFYQILDAETSEESFDQNPRGTHLVRAAQLGSYNSDTGFTKFAWLPTMNTPLFFAKDRKFTKPKMSEKDFVLGTVPSTTIEAVADISSLVEYHTAILGVTGTGKTELTLDIVREALKRQVKVFCVDFTGEYRSRLSDLNPTFPAPSKQAMDDLASKLFAAETGEYGAKKEKQALEEALKTMRQGINKQVDEFLRSEESWLAIFELGEISNSKATLRLTELYLSAIMSWAKEHRKARQVSIVLEEAHTIIPEVFGSGMDYDTQWVVGRIGQIALQGRKYGVGLLVVSQRTALVSKTILSQCNTFLTHSLIDQTSLNFLESVYSSQHVRTIPNLRRFEFLAFGKALRAERPILLRRPFDQAKKDASDRLQKPLVGAAVENNIEVEETVDVLIDDEDSSETEVREEIDFGEKFRNRKAKDSTFNDD